MDAMLCVKFGCGTFKARAARLVAVTAALMAVQAMVQVGLELALPPTAAAVLSIGSAGFFQAGLMAAARITAGGDAPSFADAFTPFRHRQADYLLVSLALCAGAIAGFIGIFGTLLLFMFAPLLVADGYNARDALVHSVRLVAANPSHCTSLGATLMVINVLGALPFGFGLLVTAPISALSVVKLLSLCAPRTTRGCRPSLAG